MSRAAHRRLAFDKGCAVSLVALFVLRGLQFFSLDTDFFESAAGQLNYCFLYLAPQSLVCCAFVPLFAPCMTGLLQHMLTPHLVVRRGSRREIATSIMPRLLGRSLSYAAVFVVTGLLAVFLKSGYTFSPAGYVTFALISIVLETAFFCACGLLMATAYVVTRSIALPVCCMALYGALDYLVSFVVKSDNPALCFGWGLTMIGPGFDLAMGLAGFIRLAAIILALLLVCMWLVAKEDLTNDGAKADGGGAGEGEEGAPRYLPPVRRSLFVRLAACVGVQACSVLYLSVYGSERAIEYALGGLAFVPQRAGQVGLLVFIVSLVPLAAFLYCFADFMGGGLGREGKLVLPRVGSRMKWALGSLFELTLFSGGFVGLGLLASVVALVPFGVAQHMGEVMLVTLRAAPLTALLVVALSYAANLMCLFFDALVSSVAVFVAHAASLLLLALVPESVAGFLARLLPSSQGILAWHDCAAWSESLVRGVQGFGVAWSLVYLALLATALGASVARRVLRSDVF